MISRSYRSILLLGMLALAGCGSDGPVVRPLASGESGASQQARRSGGGELTAGADQNGPGSDQGIGVNAYLWRGALDTLGFMPLAQTDPFGGVIITDWYSPPTTSGERFKATAYILGRQLRADGVKVSLFRQVQDGGRWVDAPISPATTGEIENRVLARARELRADAGSHPT